MSHSFVVRNGIIGYDTTKNNQVCNRDPINLFFFFQNESRQTEIFRGFRYYECEHPGPWTFTSK
jgi:hypothetical protein